MAAVSKKSNTVSNQKPKQHDEGRWKLGRIIESVGKYAVVSAVNVSTKGSKDRIQLHKAVQEALKSLNNKALQNQCKDKEMKLDTVAFEEEVQAKIEKIQQETSMLKHKNAGSSKKLEPALPEKFPPVKLNEKSLLIPNKKRIMIRSRL